MKYQPKSSHFALLAAACAGLCYLAFKYQILFFVPLVLAVIGVASLFKATNLLTREAINKRIELVLSSLDLVHGDRRFIGSQAKAVDTKCTWHGVPYNQEAHVTQLCITNSGTWFILEFEVMERRRKPYDIRISSLPNEAEVPARVKVLVASFMQPRAQYRFALSAL